RRNQVRVAAVDSRAADAADDYAGDGRRDCGSGGGARRRANAADSAASVVPGNSTHTSAVERCAIGLAANAQPAPLDARLYRLVAASGLFGHSAIQPGRDGGRSEWLFAVAVWSLAAARRRLLSALVRPAASGGCDAAASRRRFGG